jgi:hypothetical protein
MAYNINDITFIERSLEEKIDIENICKSCPNFVEVSAMQLVPIVDNEVITTVSVDLINATCNSNNSILVFSQLKKFQVCPQGKW